MNYPADEESRGIDEGSSPSAEICASNSLLQQNPVISKNLHTVRFQEMSEYREEDHSQMTKLPLVRREPPVDAVVPGVCTNKGPQRRLHSGASIAGSGSHAPVMSTFHGTEHQ